MQVSLLHSIVAAYLDRDDFGERSTRVNHLLGRFAVPTIVYLRAQEETPFLRALVERDPLGVIEAMHRAVEIVQPSVDHAVDYPSADDKLESEWLNAARMQRALVDNGAEDIRLTVDDDGDLIVSAVVAST